MDCARTMYCISIWTFLRGFISREDKLHLKINWFTIVDFAKRGILLQNYTK